MALPVVSLSGGTLACLRLAVSLRNQGDIPFVVFPTDGEATEQARRMGFKVYVRPVARWFCGFEGEDRGLRAGVAIKFLKDVISSAQSLQRLMLELKVDVVYANTSTAVGAAIAAKLIGVPCIWHVRETMNTKSMFGRSHISFVENIADILVVNSDYAGSVFGRRENLWRVYDGIPMNGGAIAEEEADRLRSQWRVGKNHLLVGAVGTVTGYKGSFLLMEAIPDILKKVPEARFVFIGSKTNPNQYAKGLRWMARRLSGSMMVDPEQMLSDMGIGQVVTFTGWIQDVLKAMAVLDVVVFPSIIAEGFGLPQVEAGVVNKPIVAFDVGPARELVTHRKTGLLVSLKDKKALADAIVHLLLNRKEASAMGVKGHQWVSRMFSYDSHFREMRRVFEAAFAKGQHPSWRKKKAYAQSLPKIVRMLVALLTPTIGRDGFKSNDRDRRSTGR